MNRSAPSPAPTSSTAVWPSVPSRVRRRAICSRYITRGAPSATISTSACTTGKVGVGSGKPDRVSSSANSAALPMLLATRFTRSAMPAKRQYCCGIRNGSPASSKVMAPPATNHSGRSRPPPGSAR